VEGEGVGRQRPQQPRCWLYFSHLANVFCLESAFCLTLYVHVRVMLHAYTHTHTHTRARPRARAHTHTHVWNGGRGG